jgi:cytochrome c oxidase subunit 2
MPTFENQDLPPQQVEISARQFEWRMRYPSPARFQDWFDREKRKDPELKQKLEKDFESFAKVQQPDDIYVVNELHAWNNHPVVVQLRTLDLIHSFNIPYMRVKQDALPGKIIPVWFKPIQANTKFRPDKNGNPHWEDGGGYNAETGEPRDRHKIWEIACAELCGWGHYRMIGRIYVHENRADFLRWLTEAEKRQRSTQPGTPTTAAP